MAQENPFSTWSDAFSFSKELAAIDPAPVKSGATISRLSTDGDTLELRNKKVDAPEALPSRDMQLLEKLADLVSTKLMTAIESNHLLLDRAKLEELKVDNQLMARHIYSLLQKRDITEQQLNHLQTEQGRMKHLFWRFYLRSV
jgi:FtsZ-binding cell division protein ZapB